VTINLGEINEYHSRHNLYFQNFLRNYEDRTTAQDETWTAYTNVKVLNDQNLPTCCSQPRLASIFSSLPNLRSVSVTLMTCPFTRQHPDFLNEIWKIPSTRRLPRAATIERFTAILSSTSSQPLQKLSHDRLPFEFFAQRPTLITTFSNAFRSLTSLSLALDYGDNSTSLHTTSAFENLSTCLRNTIELRSFSLSMLGRRKIPISDLITTLHTHNFSFPCLHTLKLEGVSCTQRELCTFLVSQKCLKTIQLGGEGLRNKHQPVNGGVHLLEGSFIEVFRTIKGGMDLERFDVMGDLKSLEYGELWVLDELVSVNDIGEYVTD